ncbi:MAG: hypothetical protein ACFFDH_13505 [Promethearchaeota archaeon]
MANTFLSPVVGDWIVRFELLYGYYRMEYFILFYLNYFKQNFTFCLIKTAEKYFPKYFRFCIVYWSPESTMALEGADRSA